MNYTFLWAKGAVGPVCGGSRKGSPCTVLTISTTPGGPRNVLVQFPDGYLVVTSWRAVRKATP